MNKLIDTEALAKKWKMSPGTLMNWRSQGVGPKFVKTGRKVSYRLIDVKKFENSNVHSSTLVSVKKNRKRRT